MLIITVVRGPDKGRVFHLGQDELIVGRGQGDVPLNDPHVSRRQLLIRRSDHGWVCCNFNTTAGTVINGHHYREEDAVPLPDGSRIRLGESLIIATIVPVASTGGAGDDDETAAKLDRILAALETQSGGVTVEQLREAVEQSQAALSAAVRKQLNQIKTAVVRSDRLIDQLLAAIRRSGSAGAAAPAPHASTSAGGERSQAMEAPAVVSASSSTAPGAVCRDTARSGAESPLGAHMLPPPGTTMFGGYVAPSGPIDQRTGPPIDQYTDLLFLPGHTNAAEWHTDTARGHDGHPHATPAPPTPPVPTAPPVRRRAGILNVLRNLR